MADQLTDAQIKAAEAKRRAYVNATKKAQRKDIERLIDDAYALEQENPYWGQVETDPGYDMPEAEPLEQPDAIKPKVNPKDLYAVQPDESKERTDLGGPGSGNWGHAGRPGEQGGSAAGEGGTGGAIYTRERDDQGYVKFAAGGGRTTALIPDVIEVLSKAGHTEGRMHRGGGPKSEYSAPQQGFVVDYRRDYQAKTETWHTYVTHAGKGKPEALPRYADALRRAGVSVSIGPMDPRRETKDVVWINPGKPTPQASRTTEESETRSDLAINLPDITDVSFPTMIGAIPAKPPRKKRRPVKYKGVSLSRAPMQFEVQVLSLTEIPPRLDAAVAELQNIESPLVVTLNDVARFGAMQVLLELVRQGAPSTILSAPPNCETAIRTLTQTVLTDRAKDLEAARLEFQTKLGKRRISPRRRDALVRELADVRKPGIIKRHAKRAVNEAFALGRAATIAMFRRRHEPISLAYQDEEGKFISKAEAIADGQILVDAVIQTAVMDTNTCEECELVDGEVMELGDERQEELHPPYVKCLGGDRCRCVQIALLSDGTEINVDEIPDEAYD
jgi:hypothetical protein